MKRSKGFTLIELLVVIAIIGILAAIVLVSLSGARDKAKDARISASLSQIRAQAEIHYDDSSYSYIGFDAAGTPVDTLISDIDVQNGGTGAPASGAVADHYCVSVENNGGTTLCVSDTGIVEQGYSCTIATGVCTIIP